MKKPEKQIKFRDFMEEYIECIRLKKSWVMEKYRVGYLSEYFGHKNINMTLRYAHPDSQLQRAVENIAFDNKEQEPQSCALNQLSYTHHEALNKPEINSKVNNNLIANGALIRSINQPSAPVSTALPPCQHMIGRREFYFKEDNK